MKRLIDTPKPGRALCFEDQYLSTGGQLYELMVGHYRFNADLRPLLSALLRARREVPGDLRPPLRLRSGTDRHRGRCGLDQPRRVAFRRTVRRREQCRVGRIHGNPTLRARIEPVLLKLLEESGLA